MRNNFFDKIIITVGICFGLLANNIYALENNVILVGTTGDYPPLSYRNESGYIGRDIEIIKNFAQAKNLRIKFIPTTWPMLSQDLSDGKFDLAVGGISENPSRKKLFYLSNSIESSAKVPLIRCNDSKRFSNFMNIDKTGIIVVENRGGTNQDFALKNIKHATITLYQQNFLALGSLNSNKNPSDVMFTDNIEAEYHHKVNSKLCIANISEKYPSSNKVFIFTKTIKGEKLMELFNSWWTTKSLTYK